MVNENTFGNFRCLLKTVHIAFYAKIVSGIHNTHTQFFYTRGRKIRAINKTLVFPFKNPCTKIAIYTEILT